MARPLRLEFAGALYHITARGNRRDFIYLTDYDREKFLRLLGEVCERYNWCCHSYCLMPNHYHLLVETPDGNLSRGMRQLNGVYTQHFNRVHERVGHVFQGRFKGILVDKDQYLLELARYIVLNPVRASMVQLAEDWNWSSYRATSGQVQSPEWLQVDYLLAAFGRRKSSAIAAYRRFVVAGMGRPSPWRLLKNQVYLGNQNFVDNMMRQIDDAKELSEVPLVQRRPEPMALSDYALESRDRDAAIVAAYLSGGFTMKEIGDHFRLHYSRISRILAQAKGKT